MNQARYISVDELQAQITLQEAAAKCGVTLDAAGTGKQVRIDCPFGCSGDHAGKREISVDTSNPQKVFCCHAYGCQARGNMMTLMHGWLTGKLPTGGKLKGDEFKRVRDVLTGTAAPLSTPDARPIARSADETPAVPKRNIPLADSENEKARELTTLDEKFIVDVSSMPPAAAMYVRRHPCLSPEAMRKWRIGVLPADGGPDKRGWSLRGQLLYPVLTEDEQLLSWIARDPQWESKDIAFNAMSPEARAQEKKPAKHRFPVDFHRGLELFGQHGSRLKEPGYRELIARCGIIVVEGFNDVLGLDTLAVPAVAIMSNKMTVEQVTKIERWSKSLAAGKVSLLFDADAPGDDGAKESLWLLAERGLDVRLGWSRSMHGEQFAERQPESLTADEWQTVIRVALERV
jgi:5S rRNA maturation endonuclease (ribonuclease M5)